EFQAANRAADDTPPPNPDRWHQTLSGRFFAGLLLAGGLSYGLLQLGAAFLSAAGEAPLGAPLSPAAGLGLFVGLQALAVLLAGVLTGAGQRQAPTLGATVGVVSGSTAIVALM